MVNPIFVIKLKKSLFLGSKHSHKEMIDAIKPQVPDYNILAIYCDIEKEVEFEAQRLIIQEQALQSQLEIQLKYQGIRRINDQAYYDQEALKLQELLANKTIPIDFQKFILVIQLNGLSSLGGDSILG